MWRIMHLSISDLVAGCSLLFFPFKAEFQSWTFTFSSTLLRIWGRQSRYSPEIIHLFGNAFLINIILKIIQIAKLSLEPPTAKQLIFSPSRVVSSRSLHERSLLDMIGVVVDELPGDLKLDFCPADPLPDPPVSPVFPSLLPSLTLLSSSTRALSAAFWDSLSFLICSPERCPADRSPCPECWRLRPTRRSLLRSRPSFSACCIICSW